MYVALRVIKDFGWNGWQFTRTIHEECRCNCIDRKRNLKMTCTQKVGTGCKCYHHDCYCSCVKDPGPRAGDIWIIEEGHPKAKQLLKINFVAYDSCLPPIETLLEDPQYSRLTLGYAEHLARGDAA